MFMPFAIQGISELLSCEVSSAERTHSGRQRYRLFQLPRAVVVVEERDREGVRSLTVCLPAGRGTWSTSQNTMAGRADETRVCSMASWRVSQPGPCPFASRSQSHHGKTPP